MEEEKLQKLAYIVSEASDIVIRQGRSQEADTYAAAVSVIVHSWTNSDSSVYQPQWPLDYFTAGTDPLGTGQNPQQVQATYDKLISDASLYAGSWDLKLTTEASKVSIGDTFTVTGVLQTTSGRGIPGKTNRFVFLGGRRPGDRCD
jgi:hypothetical protein